jgi:hypothetical protein
MHTDNKKTIRKDLNMGIIYRTVCKVRQSMFLIPQESALPPAAADNIE